MKHPFVWWWRERKQARELSADADAELERSRKLAREDRELVAPILRAHKRNQFSDIIRDALQTGYVHPHSHER